MMSGMTLEQVAQLAIAFVLGGGGMAVMAKRTMKNLTATSAEIDVIDMLRKEVLRLSEANDKLHRTLEALRTQVVHLRAENAEIRSILHPEQEAALRRANAEAQDAAQDSMRSEIPND